MKHRLSVTILAMMLVTGCQPATPTPSPVPTELPDPPAEATAEPGEVEVALALADIPDQENIAVVNGEAVPVSFYEEGLARSLRLITAEYAIDWNDPANAAALPRIQEEVLDQVIERALLLQLAREEEVTVTEEEIDAEIELMRQAVAKDPNLPDWAGFLAARGVTEETVRILISDELLKRGLSEVHAGPRVVEHVHASHILVETEELGQEVLDELADGEDFGELAAEYSTDPGSRDTGGDLGWFPRQVMVPEFEEVAFSLEPGEMSGLVESEFGYHIILVHAREDRELEESLYEQLQYEQGLTWFQEQLEQAEIERLYNFVVAAEE